MENEIKVRDFVRTKDGQIYKIEDGTEFYEDSVNVGIGIIPDVEGIWVDKEHFTYVDKRVIVKHSPNLIDLIQCGDYVNGEQVCKSRYDELYTSYVYCGGIGVRTIEAYPTFIKDMKEEDIETIVTKEMMESISYKVKQEEN